jgi:hypothetical protein
MKIVYQKERRKSIHYINIFSFRALHFELEMKNPVTSRVDGHEKA